MATTTIPETVTVPGQVAYDVLVKLQAFEEGLLRLSEDTTTGLTDNLLGTQTRFFEAAFGEPYCDRESDEAEYAPLVLQAAEDARQLFRDHFGRPS